MAETMPTRSLAQTPNNNPWSITLRVTAGPHSGQTFAFDRHDTFIVGRSKEAHFCLPEKDPFFSRLHFLIEVNPPLCRLVDLKSHNGTLVNGQKVSSVDLKDGDEIRGGTTTLMVQIRSIGAEEVPVTVAPPPAGSNPPSTVTFPGFPKIPGYRITQELGRGGMGVVYQAQRESDRREMAIKTIIPKVRMRQDSTDRFLREANILSQLKHPHIVAFEEMGQAGDLLYFAMNLVAGTDANKLVRKEGPLSVSWATRLILQVLDALAYAHEKGFVHRDLKPANILVQSENALVADFGLARTYHESPLSGLTLSGEMGGTAEFMPPEQVLNFRAAKPAADQYSAAATLYFLLTGKPTYEPTKNVQDFFQRILHEEPVRIDKRRGDLPKGLADIIHRGLAREPGQRFVNVMEMGRGLEPFTAVTHDSPR